MEYRQESVCKKRNHFSVPEKVITATLAFNRELACVCLWGERERTGKEEGGKQEGLRRHEWNLP